MRKRSIAIVTAIASLLLLVPGAAVAASPAAAPAATVVLASSVFTGIETLTSTGPIADGEVMHVGLTLAGKDPSGAAQQVHALYDATSPSYHHFFTPEQWDVLYGPDAAD